MEKIHWISSLSPVIITSIIGLIGSPIIITLIADYLFKPNLSINIFPNLNDDGRKSILEIKNEGSKQATNISLLVLTPKKSFQLQIS